MTTRISGPFSTSRPERDGVLEYNDGVGVAVFAAGLAALYAFGAQLPFWFLSFPEAGAAFFPPAGVTLAALVLTSRRRWPIWLVVIGLTEFVVDVSHGQATGIAIGFSVANMIEPLVGATAFRYSGFWPKTSYRMRLVAYIVCAVMAGPLIGGLIGATVSWSYGATDAWMATFGKWWLGDALGVLAVASPIIAFVYPSKFQWEARRPEVATMVALAVGVIVVPALLWQRPLLFAVLPFLMWAAVRGGTRAVTLAGCAVAFCTAWAGATGHSANLFADLGGESDLVYMQLFLAVTLLAAMSLAVEVMDRRRAERASSDAISARTRAEVAAMTAASNERRRIVRETHDIVGHSMNVMLLQAGAARRVLAANPDRSRELLQSIEATGRDAFRDLDVALGLADPAADMQPALGLASAPDLIDAMRRGGMHVELEVQGEPFEVPTLVDWSAYRILQEAVTNVAKHAPHGRAVVCIMYQPFSVMIRVVNDGIVTVDGRSGRHGRGLAGLRERVAVLGGDIHAGTRGDGHFALEVHLPVKGTGR